MRAPPPPFKFTRKSSSFWFNRLQCLSPRYEPLSISNICLCFFFCFFQSPSPPWPLESTVSSTSCSICTSKCLCFLLVAKLSSQHCTGHWVTLLVRNMWPYDPEWYREELQHICTILFSHTSFLNAFFKNGFLHFAFFEFDRSVRGFVRVYALLEISVEGDYRENTATWWNESFALLQHDSLHAGLDHVDCSCFSQCALVCVCLYSVQGPGGKWMKLFLFHSQLFCMANSTWGDTGGNCAVGGVELLRVKHSPSGHCLWSFGEMKKKWSSWAVVQWTGYSLLIHYSILVGCQHVPRALARSLSVFGTVSGTSRPLLFCPFPLFIFTSQNWLYEL